LNSFLESKPLSNPSQKLSADGQGLVADVREVVREAKNLLLSKNDGNLLQDFIWQTQQFDHKNVSAPDVPVGKEQAQQHGNQALEGLRTLGTLLITNGQFRKLRMCNLECLFSLRKNVLTRRSPGCHYPPPRYGQRCRDKCRRPR
jgi:DNA ligase-4